MERLARGCQTAAECAEVAAEMPTNAQLMTALILISSGLAAGIVILWRAPRTWPDGRVVSLAAVPAVGLLLAALLALAL